MSIAIIEIACTRNITEYLKYVFKKSLIWSQLCFYFLNKAYILILKPTRCTNFSNLFLEKKSTCFGQFLFSSSGVQYCIHSNKCTSYRLCWPLASRIPLASSQHDLYDINLLLCVQYWTSEDGQRNCPKHVEFYSKIKFEKLVHLVGFSIRMYHDARSPERKKEHILLHY